MNALYDDLLVDWFQKNSSDWTKEANNSQLDNKQPEENKQPERVYGVGNGRHGQLADAGRRCPIPQELKQLKMASFVAAGLHCTFMIDQDGQVKACGEGTFGRLGLGSSDDVYQMTNVTGLQGYIIRYINTSKGGDGHTLAISDSGEVLSWGDGDYGKLGHGNNERQRRPKIIETLSNIHVIKAGTGWNHTVVLTKQGKVYSFGYRVFFLKCRILG